MHLGCYTIMTASVIFLRFWLIRKNKIKERMREALNEQDGFSHAFDDRTDGENIHFIYMY